MQHINVPFYSPIPSKKNGKRIVHWGQRSALIANKQYLSWKAGAEMDVRAALGKVAGVFPLEKAKQIQIELWFQNNRRCDLTNLTESVMDALVDGGAIKDDRWQVTGTVQMIPRGIKRDRPGPFCVATIFFEEVNRA